jgi:hypothetical protein
LIVGVRKSKDVKEGKKGKKGVDVKTGREGICSLVSCTGGREGIVGFGVDARKWEEGKNEMKSDTPGGRSDAELRESVHCIRAARATPRTSTKAIKEHKVVTLRIAELGIFPVLVGHVDCLLEEYHLHIFHDPVTALYSSASHRRDALLFVLAFARSEVARIPKQLQHHCNYKQTANKEKKT